MANKAPPKKASRKAGKKLSILAYLFIILGLPVGFAGGLYFYKTKMQNSTSASVLKPTPSISQKTKESIIKEIVGLNGIDKMIFSQTMLPKIKAELLERDPYSPILTQETFWRSFQNEERDQLDAIDGEFIELSTKFYNQFSKQELEKYLTMKKLPISNKIRDALSESMKDASSDRETFKSLTDLIKNFLDNGEK